MGKKNGKPLPSQVIGIIWFSIGLLIIAGISIFSYLHTSQNVETARETASESDILTQKEDSVYASRRAARRAERQYPRSASDTRHYADTKPLYSNVPAPRRKQELNVELNSADTLTLQLLHGIGPAYANRIVRYRERLGGFVSTDQLLEVYGFTPELLAHIEPYLRLDTAGIRRIDINGIDLKSLSRHPYIEYYQARDIVRLRSKGVVFNSEDDLRAVPSMADSTLRRIGPYLDFGPARNKKLPDIQ